MLNRSTPLKTKPSPVCLATVSYKERSQVPAAPAQLRGSTKAAAAVAPSPQVTVTTLVSVAVFVARQDV